MFVLLIDGIPARLPRRPHPACNFAENSSGNAAAGTFTRGFVPYLTLVVLSLDLILSGEANDLLVRITGAELLLKVQFEFTIYFVILI